MNYHFLSVKMKTLFKSQELLELVESVFAYQDEDHAQWILENRKKYWMQVFLIQQYLHDYLFPQI